MTGLLSANSRFGFGQSATVAKSRPSAARLSGFILSFNQKLMRGPSSARRRWKAWISAGVNRGLSWCCSSCTIATSRTGMLLAPTPTLPPLRQGMKMITYRFDPLGLYQSALLLFPRLGIRDASCGHARTLARVGRVEQLHGKAASHAYTRG